MTTRSRQTGSAANRGPPISAHDRRFSLANTEALVAYWHARGCRPDPGSRDDLGQRLRPGHHPSGRDSRDPDGLCRNWLVGLLAQIAHPKRDPGRATRIPRLQLHRRAAAERGACPDEVTVRSGDDSDCGRRHDRHARLSVMTNPPAPRIDEDTVDVVQAAGQLPDLPGRRSRRRQDLRDAQRGPAPPRARHRHRHRLRRVPRTDPHRWSCCQGFETSRRKVVDYRGSTFEEMDLDAVLARNPTVALVDELAHTNVPGSGRNTKRWEDVLELLEAGIDVITTVNIQHLESLADAGRADHRDRRSASGSRTGWCARPTRSSSSTRHRSSSDDGCSTGTSIPRTRSRRPSLTSSGPKTSLALRELALRFLADETDEALLEYLRRHDITDIWETTERILVCVTGAPGTDALVTPCRQVGRPAQDRAPRRARDRRHGRLGRDSEALKSLRTLASDLGAHWDAPRRRPGRGDR